ncbi:MAG TPA: 2-hydroxyacyl-CoA dehydratase family protein [Syntrophorhabdaceae bacterium]|nr:2-hydroxyacyl-CoA dehydratase family protein [Syntrophorhabdaceae bacterium]HPU29052.1 2-hydroxyacyl-CoA dehydratase family protein [Syntrophorhabdaceae bacterium]
MAEEKKGRALATKAAASIPKFVRGNLAATIKAKEEGKKVAYAYIADGQDEIMRAMDIVPAWGESFAGVCAAKRDAEKYLQKAESDNFSRSLCTYATCTIGFDMIRSELGVDIVPDAPWGGMGRPDMILGSAQLLCDPRFKWPQATQHYLRDVPIFVGAMYYPPFDPKLNHHEQEKFYVKYCTEELRECVKFCEKHTGKKMDWDRLAEIVELSDKTWDLFIDTYELRKAIPTPMDTGDAMNTMVPLTFNLGTQEAYDFYKQLYDELQEKVKNKEGVVEPEKYRLIWAAGLPSWFALGDFQYFNSKGATFPVEVTYRGCEKIERLELPKTSDPLEHIAWRWVRYWTHWYDKARKRPGSLPKVERIIEYIEEYKCDGVVFHSAFSCRSWHAGIIHQAETLKKVYKEIPILILEGDIVDISSYNEADTHNRIDAFIEAVDAYKSRMG